MLISFNENWWKPIVSKDELCRTMRHPENRGEFKVNDFYHLQMIFQQADRRAAIQRKTWKVIQGGKGRTTATESVHQETGQLAWMF